MSLGMHILKRYCERILGMMDEKEIKKYINDNRDEITKDIMDIKDKSKHIFTGMIGDNVVRNFYITENICFVCGEKDNIPITMYKLQYGFSSEIDLKIVEGLYENIINNRNKLDNIKDRIAIELPQKQNNLDIINKEIGILEEQLNIVKSKKNVIENEIDLFSKEIKKVDLEIEKFATKLVYCINYKTDILCNNGKEKGIA